MKVKGYQTYRNILILILVIMSFFLITKTLAVSNPYLPGQTQDPACGPGDPFCTVTLGSRLYTENPNSFNISNKTTGTNAIAIGTQSQAVGNASIAIGHGYQGDPGAEAEGQNSIAVGQGAYSSGLHSSAIGPNAVATGDYSTALGYISNAFGMGSVSIGVNARTFGDNSSALGVGTVAHSFREIVLGSYPTDYTPASASSWSDDDRLLVIGIGQDSLNRANALTVMKNGNVGFGNLEPEDIAYPLQMESGSFIDENGVLFDMVYPGAQVEIELGSTTEMLRDLYIVYMNTITGVAIPGVANPDDLPESLVKHRINDDPRLYAIAHNRLVPLLIKSIQELDMRITDLEDQVEGISREAGNPCVRNPDSQYCQDGDSIPMTGNEGGSGVKNGGEDDDEEGGSGVENGGEDDDEEGGRGVKNGGEDDDEEGGRGRAQVIQASNDLNLTNILLIIASLLLLVNVVVGIRRNER